MKIHNNVQRYNTARAFYIQNKKGNNTNTKCRNY